jgi:DNA (cytosine-5)-methyltransferase 1
VAHSVGSRLEVVSQQQAWGEREAAERGRPVGGVANSLHPRWPEGRAVARRGSLASSGGISFWSDCEWIECTDGKARPVESGSFPLAHGIPGRVGKLRAYGNAIVPQVAAQFIKATMRSADD